MKKHTLATFTLFFLFVHSWPLQIPYLPITQALDLYMLQNMPSLLLPRTTAQP